MANFIKAPNIEALSEKTDCESGTIAYCEEEQKMMFFSDGRWLPVEGNIDNNGLQLNLYELNKQVVSQLPPFDEIRKQDAIETINAWKKANLYMLYGREINYFTVMMKETDKPVDFKDFGAGVMELLNDITDTIYALDVVDENSIEIWVKYEDITTVLYLFNYEQGLTTYAQ